MSGPAQMEPAEAAFPASVVRTVPRAHRTVKGVASFLAAVLVMPLVLVYRATAALLPDRRDEVFQGYSQLASLWPGFTGAFLRRAFYQRTLKGCSPDCYIGFGTLFATPAVAIGRHVHIGPRCLIAHAVIGDDVLIGSNVDIVAGRHTHGFDRLDVPMRLQGGRYDTISIARDVWIGNGATVIADVGEQAIVAAGAVVVKPVNARTIVGGNPARVLAERTEELPRDRP